MSRTVWVALAAAVCLAHGGHGHPGETGTPKQPITVSPSGEFRGTYNVTRRGRQFEAYRGIRYAEPPVGELRFQPPQPILQHRRPVDATRDGPSCPRPAAAGSYLDEDCLTINVYTPARNDRGRPLPVIFWMHPGGFYGMTGRSDFAGPHYLLDRDLVLVTINYRLATLGFLSTGDELAPGNNGFKDQVAALRWVQRNIAAFGGDPGSVTISGCSAGSRSVMLHMISPMSKGLFHRGISMSGSPVRKAPTPRDLKHLAVRQAELLNCSTESSKAIVDCLKTKPWQDLGSSLRGFFEFGFDPVSLWHAVVENDFGQERFLDIDPADAIRQGRFHAVPYIISQTEDEFFWFGYNPVKNSTLREQMNNDWDRVAPISFVLPRHNSSEVTSRLRKAYLQNKPLVDDQTSVKKLGRLYADAIVGFPVHRLANLMVRHSPRPVWYYEFSYVGNHSHYEDPLTKKPVAAGHHDDMIYLFSLRYRFPDVGLEGKDATLVDRMTAIWYNFAKHGDPNPHGSDPLPELQHLQWPEMTPAERTYLRIGEEFSLHQNLFEDRFQLWEELYPIQY